MTQGRPRCHPSLPPCRGAVNLVRQHPPPAGRSVLARTSRAPISHSGVMAPAPVAAPIRPTQQRAGAPSGAPGLLLCQEAGVSRCAPGRPRGQSPLARSEQAHNRIGLSLARQSERLAAPLELGVARCRGEWTPALVLARGLVESRQRSVGGACGEVASTGGGVRLRLPGCALLRVAAGSQESTGSSVIPESCCGFTTPKPLTRGVPARRRDRRGRRREDAR